MGFGFRSIVDVLGKAGHDVSDELKRAIRNVEKHPSYAAGLLGLVDPLTALGLGKGQDAYAGTHPFRGMPGVGANVGDTLPYDDKGKRETNCVAVDSRDGAIRKPYTLNGRIIVAASSFAIDTSGGDFLAAAAVDDITTDNVVPFGVKVTQAMLVISMNENAAAPIATPAHALSLQLRYFVNGIEEARWPVAKFNPVISMQGAGTSAAALIQIPYKPVPFELEFSIAKTYKLQLFTPKAFTPVAVIDAALILDGMR